jgi:hypothetical protein
MENRLNLLHRASEKAAQGGVVVCSNTTQATLPNAARLIFQETCEINPY